MLHLFELYDERNVCIWRDLEDIDNAQEIREAIVAQLLGWS